MSLRGLLVTTETSRHGPKARNDGKAIMGFLKKLFGSEPAKSEKRYYTFQVKCNRCGEIIEGRVDLEFDLTPNHEGSRTTYFVRKVLIGNNRCFQQIEVEMKLGEGHWLEEKKIQGGEFVE